MRVRIWIDDWQMECCGKPFAIGDTVTWSLSAQVDSERLLRILGATPRVHYAEDHHGLKADAQPIRGVVGSISAAYARFRRDPETDVPAPVAGSSTLHAVTSARRFPRRLEGIEFVGYLVTLEVP